MNAKRRRLPVKKGEKKSSMSKVYIVFLLVAVVIIGWWFLREFNFRNQYNEVMSSLDRSFKNDDLKGIEGCMNTLERMQTENSSNPDRVKLINMNLVKCYRFFSMRYEAPLKVQVEYLRKIEKISPEELTNEDKKIMEIKF